MPNIDVEFNDTHVDYNNKIKAVLHDINYRLGLGQKVYIGFIKNDTKYVLDVKGISIGPKLEDATLTASGVVWKGGYISMDGVDVDSGFSRAGFASNVAISSSDIGTGTWDDEINTATYFAVYSPDVPIVINNFIHTSTVDFSDDILELCLYILPEQYERILSGFSAAVYRNRFSVVTPGINSDSPVEPETPETPETPNN